MFHVVRYKGVPEVWEEEAHETVLIHLGSNYSITGKKFHKRSAAKDYVKNLLATEKLTKN